MLAGASKVAAKADLLVCPPATLIAGIRRKGARSKTLTIGAQDCHPRRRAPIPAISQRKCSGMPAPAPSLWATRSGAPITAKVTCWFGRRPKQPGAPASPPSSASAKTQRQRDSGQTLDICGGQLGGSLPEGASSGNLVVAYEPVWAIGTGVTPTAGDVEQIHKFIRDSLIARFKGEGAKIRILYGGFGETLECAELMAVANVNGALVGGASLKASDFSCDCARLPLSNCARLPLSTRLSLSKACP